MPRRAGLSKCDLIAFVPIVDVVRAKAFYRDVLGLRLVMEEPLFALEFEANGIMLRLVMLKKLPAGYGSVVGWKVPVITAAAKRLRKSGVSFERYPYLKQDKLGIWTSPTGAKVAWFKDPDGNILSISQHPSLKQ